MVSVRGLVLSILAVVIAASAAVALRWGPFGSTRSSREGGSGTLQTPVGGKESTAAEGGAGPRSAPVPRGPIHFTEVTRRSGVDFVHVSGDSPEKPFPAANGSGVAALDFDLDGQIDLYFLTGGPLPLDPRRRTPVNRCYRNQGDWQFLDVTGPTGLGDNGYSAGTAVGDYDSDGFPDVFINGFGAHRLYRNQGDGTFVEVGFAAGIADDRWGTSAAFLDYDNDGLLDLYVCHYAAWSLETNKYCGDRDRGVRTFCNPTSVEPIPHLLLHNEGDGRFRDAAAEAGLAAARGRGQGVVAADLDGDGRIDLFVGNDLSGNFLFLNSGDGTFRDVSQESGTASDFMGRYQAGMGVDAADVNRDGNLDLFVTTFEGEHDAFYENLGNGLFHEVSRSRGLATDSLPWVGWGTLLADFDLDGWPDVVVTNGHTDANLRDMGRDSPYAQPPGLWHNRNGRFEYAGGGGAGDYFAQPHVGRGLAAADLDNDGDLDLVIVHQDAPPALLRNDCLPSFHPGWIRVQLIGTASNRDAIGATLRVIASSGERLQGKPLVQQVKGGGSYLSAHDLRQVMAIPEEAATFELQILWPSGNKSECLSLGVREWHRIVEGRSKKNDGNQ